MVVALGVALSKTILSANAQNIYTAGLLTMKTSTRGQEIELKQYFRSDSTATTFSAGPVIIELLADADYKFFAVLADVPAANIKSINLFQRSSL